ncbi:UV DNA damage repair endonuclease UvsE [bacterium]|nr:MAG: UV DNA damage repair endonuclease UvsE [bacterium]
MRLGFAVKVLGQPGLKSNDSRRWQNNPHLKVSIEYVNAIFDYLEKANISMYRISSDFAPYLTHPDMPQFHQQIEEAKTELEELGKRANRMNLRLSFHPSQYIILNSPSEKITATSMRDFMAQATILDVMEQGSEAVVVTHVGGVYGDRDASMARFVEHFKALPEPAQRRLVLENDDVSYSAADVLKIHAETGIRCIFDHQHHNCINPEGWSPEEACSEVLKTWPEGCRPKIHFSSPRQEDREILRVDKTTGKKVAHAAPPLASQHAEYIDAATFIPFAREVRKTREFDVMCEAKSKDLAVLKLRAELEAVGDFQLE